MGIYVQVVCNECGARGPGDDGRYGTAAGPLREAAQAAGWEVRLPSGRFRARQRDLCPECAGRARTPEGE